MSSLSWPTTAEDFGRYLVTVGKSQQTRRTYTYNVALFWRWCVEHEVDPATADQRIIRAWIEERLGTTSSARVHNDVVALTWFFRWLEELDLHVTPARMRNVRIKRRESLPTEPLDDDELAALLAACTIERDRCLLLLMMYTGLRVAEVAAMRSEDINWSAGTIRVVGKGDKERLVSPAGDVLGRMHAWLGFFHEGRIWRSQRSGRPLTPHQLSKIITEIGVRAGIEHVHAHRLRATFATKFIEQFRDLDALQGLMGHASVETTTRYTLATKAQRGLASMRKMDFKL